MSYFYLENGRKKRDAREKQQEMRRIEQARCARDRAEIGRDAEIAPSNPSSFGTEQPFLIWQVRAARAGGGSAAGSVAGSAAGSGSAGGCGRDSAASSEIQGMAAMGAEEREDWRYRRQAGCGLGPWVT